MITLLLVDDPARVCPGLRLALELEPDLAVLGEAADAATALELARALRPDVVLMDLALPGLDGVEATAALSEGVPDCAVVILSLHDSARARAQVHAAGAAAFVGKHEPASRLLSTIRQVAAPRSGADPPRATASARDPSGSS